MRTTNNQIDGLKELAKEIMKSEVNCAIVNDPNNVPYLYPLDTPNSSQIVYASGGYDVWTDNCATLQASNLSITDAAKVVVAEYLLAKAGRVKAHSPDLNIGTIMDLLQRGYQRKPD